MGIFIDDSFEGDLVGSFPAGFYSFDLGGNVQLGGDPNPSGAGGFHCFQFSASGGIGVGPLQGLTAVSSICINYSIKNLLNAGISNLLLSINARDVNNLNGGQITAFGYNSDGTFYIQSGSVLICSSYDTLILDEWMYVQVDLSYSSTLIGGVPYITVNGQIVLNGKKIADSGGQITSSIPTSIYQVGVGANDYEWSPPGFFGGLIDNITLSTPSNSGVPYYPHGGTSKIRTTQAVIEVAELPNSANLRLTQGVMEVLELPTTANLRLTQAIIELVTQGGGGGWEIYEA